MRASKFMRTFTLFFTFFFPLFSFAGSYARTPGDALPKNPVSFKGEQSFGEDVVGCGDERFQLVIFEGEKTNYGDAGHYFPVSSSASSYGFSINESGNLKEGARYGNVAVFTFSPEDTDVPNCDVNILEYGAFTISNSQPARPAGGFPISNQISNPNIQIQNNSDLIENLKKQIADLQAQIEKLRGGASPPEVQKFVFTKFLWKGIRDPDVERLQEFLARPPAGGPEIYPEGFVTGYFGELTEAAVKKFQARHGILQTGFVGELTTEKLNEMIF